MGVKTAAAVLVLAIAVAPGLKTQGSDPNVTPGLETQGSEGPTEPRVFRPGVQQKTTKDKLFTKEQAGRGQALYVKHCERCHDPAKVPDGKKPGPPTIGAKFIETWLDRTVGELFSSIYTTMPNDGTAVLTTDETLDLVAHLLKANGYPEGTAPLKNDDVMKNAVIVK